MKTPPTGVAVVADPDGGNVWAYACSSCRRVAIPYYAEQSARLDAAKHDCATPRHHESCDPLQYVHATAFAGLVAAAWAALLDGWTPQ